jgi:hypothetical protein
MSGEQESIFFAELVGRAQLVKLQAGDTFIMPSGQQSNLLSNLIDRPIS